MCVCVCGWVGVCVGECIFRQQIIIQACFVKDDGTLFIISNFIFSRLFFYFSIVGI